MKTSIELPDHKYRPGDFIRVGIEEGDHPILWKIARVESFGTWAMVMGNPAVQIDRNIYVSIIQEGNRKSNGDPLRPGITVQLDCHYTDNHATVADIAGPGVDEDTERNLSQRWEDWDHALETKG